MICAFILIFFLVQNKDWVIRYIFSMAFWMLFCFLITETLSVENLINTKNLRITWLVIDIALVIVNIIRFWRKRQTVSIRDFFNRITCADKRIWIWLVFAMGMAGLAVKTVPYNFDSMTYHLPRLFHWMQNGSVGHYATAIDRQIGSPIGAAYVNLHVYVMSGGSDRFINLLQCCSYLTNGVLVYYIARKIGCSKKYCNMAMVIFYTMPIAVAEAFTTQVDNFSALWMLATVYLLMDLLSLESKMILNKDTIFRVIGLSLCVGFGYLTKPSIGIGLLFFAGWLLLVVIKRKDTLRTIALCLLVAGVILVLLLAPGFYHNIITFEALSAPNVGKRQLIGTLNPIQVLVNCIKNITFNMPTIWIYESGPIIYTLVMGLASLLNVDINNPAISEDGGEFLVYNAQKFSHDRAVNSVIAYFLIVCVILWIVRNRKKHKWEIKNCYFVVAVLSFVTFCAMLRWEPYVSRYMISYMAVLCPALVGQLELIAANEDKGRWKHIEIGIYTLVYFVSIGEATGLANYHVNIAMNNSRYSGYFENNQYVEEDYRAVTEYVNEKGHKNIGLLLGGNTYEYPLTVMLNEYERMEHINVTNATKIYEDMSFVPDVIISMESGLSEEKIIYHGIEYHVVENIAENVCILEPIDS